MLKPERRPTHPGIMLKELHMKPQGITITRLAEAVGRTRKNISEVVNGHTRIDAELAVRLAEVLGTSARLWLNAQNAVDIWDERTSNEWTPSITFIQQQAAAT